MKQRSAPPKLRKPIPQRMCVVCRQTAAKGSLVRIVRAPDGSISLDRTGKRNGRGAYLCDKIVCWQRAASTEVLANALKITLTEADRAHLRDAAPTYTQMDTPTTQTSGGQPI